MKSDGAIITPKKLIQHADCTNNIHQQWTFIEEGNTERIIEMAQGLGACLGQRSLSSS
jgi:hypothetical protein